MLFLGHGYVARRLVPVLAAQGWALRGTGRDVTGRAPGTADIAYQAGSGLPAGALNGIDHVLVSIPPDKDSGHVARDLAAELAVAPGNVRWIGYLSATSVYGDAAGGWVDESTAPRPSSPRGSARLEDERTFLELGSANKIPVAIFRLAGIYGPGRSAFDQLRAGQARRIDKPGHFFSRIHVDDIVAVLQAAITRPRAGAIYNLADDEPAASAEVAAYAARLLGIEPPPLIAFDQAKSSMSPMALSFWSDNKRVANALIKSELGVVLAFPNYRLGLKAIAAIP